MFNKICDLFFCVKFIADANEKSFQFLKKANDKSERIWNIYFTYVMGGYLLSIPMSTASSILLQTNDFDTNNLYHAYRVM